MSRVCGTAMAALIVLCLMLPIASGQSSTLPQFGHVVIVMGENTGFSSTYNTGAMPYLDSLASKYGLAVNYYGDTHPSIGNYMVLSTGKVLTNNDGDTPSSFPVSADNIALEAQKAGKTWKDYVENLPSASGCGGLSGGSYYVRHDPLEYMTSVNSGTAHYVCFSQFSADVKNHALPNLSWLVPNGSDDGHDTSATNFDNWLKSEIAPLLQSSYFQSGGDGLLIITFDEDENTGNSCGLSTGTSCGGQVETVVISAQSKPGYQSSIRYEHENALRTMAQGLGLATSGLGAASSAAPMADFFGAPSGSVSLTPSSLSFASQTVGTSSSSQALTLKNGTAAAVSISNLAVGGTNSSSFTQLNNCGSSLGAGGSCSVNVIFTPAITGALSATLSVTDSASNSPQKVSLSGTGAGSAAASVSPSSLSFGSTSVGTTRAAQTVTLSNTGTTALSISSISAGTPFAETNTCGSSLAAAAKCSIQVAFKPSVAGTVSGTLKIADNAAGSPQSVSLSGTGTATGGGGAPVASMSPTSLTFASTTVGSTSAAQTVTLSNTGTAALSISSISAGAPFAETNTCGSSLAAAAKCSIQVTFKPSTAGTASGTLTITDNATGSPQKASLIGTATAPSSGPNYYVATTGSDSAGKGSASSPWATVLYASTQIGPGATVHVEPGTYTVSPSSLITNASGTSSAPITYVSDTPYAAKLVSPSWNGDLGESVWVNTGNYVVIKGFDLSGDAYQGIDNAGTNVVIEGNHVHNIVPKDCNGNGGAGIDDYGDNSSDIGNTVNDVGNFSLGSCIYVHGIYANRNGGKVWNNIIYHIWSFGIQVWGSGPQNITISGNTIFNNGVSGLVIGADTTAASNMMVTDNIFINNKAYGFEEEGVTGSNHYVDNLTYGNGITDFNLQTGSASGTITGKNPMFVNYQPDGGDVHLTSSSPAMNGGTSQGAASYDFAGSARPAARPSGSGWDIGAYEFGGTGGTSGSPVVSMSPTSLTFGSTNVGTTSAAQTVTLSNTGSVALSITGVSAGAPFAETSGCGSSLAAGAKCSIQVTFKPSASGSASGTLTITDNATGSPQSVKLSGTGATSGSPLVSMSPTSLTFGSTNVGTTSAAQTVTLSNTGSAALSITGVSASSPFAETSGCGSSLAAGAKCTIQVTFKPSASGSASGTLTITDNATGSPQSVKLSGTGATSGSPLVSVSPTSLTFSSTTVRSTSAAQTVTLSNTGSVALSITGVSASAPFADTSGCGSSLAAGAHCSIQVTFKPSASGSASGTLTIADNATGSPQTVKLSGTGATSSGSGSPVASLSSLSLTFSSTSVGTTATEVDELTNTGKASLTIAAISTSGPFSETNNCGSSLAAGAPCSIHVSFKPTTTGTASGTLTITDNAAGSPQTVKLSGTGTGTTSSSLPAASLSSLSLTFSSTSVGTTATEVDELTNTGKASLLITRISTSGAFSETNNCGSSLAAGARCSIHVTFKPTVAGTASGTLAITDNATGSPQNVRLSGVGVAASSVVLSPSSLSFAGQVVGTSGAAQPVTLKNSGTSAVTISGIAFAGANAGEFSVDPKGTTCAKNGAVGANGSCTFAVKFTAAASGAQSAALEVTDTAAGSPQAAGLSGMGTDFSIGPANGSSTSATVSPGQTANCNLAVAPISGFSGSVALSCAGAPATATCSITPAAVSISGNSPANVTVHIATTGMGFVPRSAPPKNKNLFELFGLALCAMLFLAVFSGKPTRRVAAVFPAMALFLATCLSGCALSANGNTGSLGTPTGSYKIAVSAQSQGVTHSVQLSLTVA